MGKVNFRYRSGEKEKGRERSSEREKREQMIKETHKMLTIGQSCQKLFLPWNFFILLQRFSKFGIISKQKIHKNKESAEKQSSPGL